MQNRIDALFKQIARDCEYFDRGAAVFVAKHHQQNIKENQFHVANAPNDVCINTFLLCGCMKIKSVQNLRTK